MYIYEKLMDTLHAKLALEIETIFKIPSKSFANLLQIITSNLASAPYKMKSRIALVSDSDQGLVPIYVGWHVSVEVCLRW